MTDGHLDAQEMDLAVATRIDGTPSDGGERRRSALRRALTHPVGALVTLLLVLTAVLGARSYVVSRPPPVATTIDAKLGASFGDTGFIYTDDTKLTMALTLRLPSTGKPVVALDFVGPGITDVVLHQNEDRVSVIGTTDCASLPAAAGPADYRLRVVQTDAWQREVRADLSLPSVLAQQVAFTTRLSCTAEAARSVELLALSLRAPGTAVATLVNRGGVPLYLHHLGVSTRDYGVEWAPITPATLPADGRPVDVALVGPDKDCRATRPRAHPTAVAGLALDALGDASTLDWMVSVPAASRATASSMAWTCR